MWANPNVYPMLPVRVATTGRAQSVRVRAGADWVDASDSEGDGVWLAQLPISSLAAGVNRLEAEASAPDRDTQHASADLVLGAAGLQWTDFTTAGPAGTPRILHINDGVYLSWTDRSTQGARAEAWLRRIDGAGRPMGDAVPLVGGIGQTIYARTAVGASSIGVLYQQQGGPYTNFFKRTDLSGRELAAAMPLDPAGRYGSFGGDIVYDSGSFFVVFRTNDGMGGGEVRWMRVDEATGQVTGPEVVASSGHDDPHGVFQPISFIRVAALGGGSSLVSFVRGEWSQALTESIPRSQIALLRSDGTVAGTSFAGQADDLTFHDEARLFRIGDDVVPIWSAISLTSTETNPPKLFFSTTVDAQGTLDPSRGTGTVVLDAPGDRYEPVVVGHPEQYAVMAWLDGRSYEVDLQNGRIELYVAPLSRDRRLGTATVFPHARFVADAGDVNALAAGTNVLLVWIDERHGMGIANPKPEVYFETAWY
jgi:hypothetical protein